MPSAMARRLTVVSPNPAPLSEQAAARVSRVGGLGPALQTKHGPDFSPQHEFHRQVQSVFWDFPGRTGFDGRAWASAIAIFYAAIRFSRATCTVQP